MKRKGAFLIVLAVALLNISMVAPKSFDKQLAALVMKPDSIESAPENIVVVNVSIVGVANLYGWEVTVLFDPSILNCTNARYPADHVFAGKNHWNLPPAIYNDKGYVTYGCLLFQGENGFSGSGTLCQIEFKVLKQARALLTFHKEYTYLLDPDGNKIPIQGWEMPGKDEEDAVRRDRNFLASIGWKNVSLKDELAGGSFTVQVRRHVFIGLLMASLAIII